MGRELTVPRRINPLGLTIYGNELGPGNTNFEVRPELPTVGEGFGHGQFMVVQNGEDTMIAVYFKEHPSGAGWRVRTLT